MPIVSVNLCDQCLDGVGGYCNNPECALCRSVAPDAGPIRDMTAPCGCATQRTQLLTEIRERVEAEHKAYVIMHQGAAAHGLARAIAIIDEFMEGGE